MVLLALLVLAFAALVTAHVTLAVGLARRGPWWRGLVAFALVPLAPLWGWRAGLRGRVGVWAAAALVYGAALARSFAG